MKTIRGRGELKDVKRCVREVKRVMKENELNTLPSRIELIKIDGGLASAIEKYHGGYRVFRDLLGESQRRSHKRRIKVSMNRLTDLKDCVRLAKEIKSSGNFDRLPSEAKLVQDGYSGLYNAIEKYHGGIRKFRGILGEDLPRRSGQLKDLDYCVNLTKSIIRKNKMKKTPSQKLLQGIDGGLSNAINAYHGGIRKFREALGEESDQKPSGTWKDLDYCLDYARRLRKLNGWDRLPNGNYLARHNHSSFTTAVTKYHGGWKEFREALGEESDQKPSGTWKDLDYCLDYAEKLKRENDCDRLPGQNTLLRKGHSSFVNAVKKYHGGIRKFREALGEPEVIRDISQLESFFSEHPEAKAMAGLVGENGYSTDVAEVFYKMWPGRFPSASDLARSLPGAVKKIGHSLHPFTMEKARGFYNEIRSIPQEIKYSLDNILYSMAVEQYQKPFNSSPTETLRDLKTLTQEKNGVGNLAKAVLNYYQSVYNFNIPGFGSLRKRKG